MAKGKARTFGQDLMRGEHVVGDASAETQASTGTSIFDPVLCELNYRWFCPPGGVILDPFAGGSVRGIVASVLGYRYHGAELRGEQVEANRAQLGIAARSVAGMARRRFPQYPRDLPRIAG